jgi:hypothetical protein
MKLTYRSALLGDEPLPESFFEPIARAFAQEHHLLPVTSASFCESFAAGLALIGVSSAGEPVACTRLTPLLDNTAPEQFYELGSTWVRPDYRDQQINHEMYRIFLGLHQDKLILATTTNYGSLKVGQDLGLVQVRRRQLPEKVWRASCTCPSAKTGCTRANEGCTRAYGEEQLGDGDICWFRITPRTADCLHL